MPRRTPTKAGRGTIAGAIASVVAAKGRATGRAWSLLHRTESMLTLAAGRRRATTHAMKAKAKAKRKGGKKS